MPLNLYHNSIMDKERFFKPGQGSGDDGFTDLLGGRRVSKTNADIKLNAVLDDLNANLGLLRAELFKNREKNIENCSFSDEIEQIQRIILKISAKNAGMDIDISKETALIVQKTKELNRKAVPPKEFIIPGDNMAEALAHVCRTKTRLCEIAAWEAQKKDSAKILNRLSDYLFIIAVALRKV